MAILKEKVELKEGSSVTPELINDTVETSLDAHRKSVEAKSQSDIALKKSVEAELHSEKSERRVAEMKQVVGEVERKLASGELNGANGVTAETKGMFGFQIEDGNLYVVYSGDTAPDLQIDGNGNLIYNF